MRLKLSNWDVVMREVPDEITLALNLSDCPNNCKGCHSPQLRMPIGQELTFDVIQDLISKNDGITCISFMGGDRYPEDVNYLAQLIKTEYCYTIRTCWYSGCDKLSPKINLRNFDYIKIGSYMEDKGPLDNPNTNQRMYHYSELYPDVTIGKGWRNITSLFWKK